MKKILIYGCLIGLGISVADSVSAQARRRTPARNVAATTPTPPPVDTPVVVAPPPPIEDTIPLRTVENGRRPSTTIDSGSVTIMDKIPLKYDNIRLDDQVYRQVIWRVIDTREKMNMGFNYEADEDNGNQRFMNILLKHIKEGDVTAFDAVNDRFTTPLTVAQVAKMLAGVCSDIEVSDFENDPTGELKKIVRTCDEFDPTTIQQFAVKEEIIFDRETSRLHFRTLGIAPIKFVFNEDGSFRNSYRMMWLYYPDLRKHLSRYDAYNPRNMGARMSWEEVFESRFYSSYIYKSTLNNPTDRNLELLVKDPLMRLLEGDKIKETIFNWEQDQWSY